MAHNIYKKNFYKKKKVSYRKSMHFLLFAKCVKFHGYVRFRITCADPKVRHKQYGGERTSLYKKEI